MNRPGLTPLALALLAIPSTLRGQDRGEPPLARLRAEHPRLIAVAGDDARIKALIAEQPLAREYWDQIHAAAVDLLDEATVMFEIVGPRLLTQSRRCLDRMYVLGTAYRLTGEQRFVDRAVTELAAAAAFPHWNPSHFLDTAELCHAFGIGYDWFHAALTPEQRQMVRGALVEKGLVPGRKSYEGTERYGGWIRARHNWNQVCVGGVSIGALAVADEEPELCGFLVRKGLESIRNSMAEFAPDGGWKEGPGYWNYATSYNVYYLAALTTALGSDFGLCDMPGFSNTGTFRIHFCGPAGETFNYADAGSGIGRAPQMLWLARRFDRPAYAWHERSMSGRPHPLDLWWFDPRGAAPGAEAIPLDALYTGIDVAFLRGAWDDPRAVSVGFKGGDNRANHSHLDLGTFVLDAAGKRWAADLGGDDYNMPGYFGSQRWTYFRLRTEGHNTLLLNGENQDPAARAPIVAFGSTNARAFAVADLSAAYAKHARRVWRGIALLDRAQVLVRDEIDVEQPTEIVWTMLTRAEVETRAATALLTIGDERLTAALVDPPDGARFQVLGAQPPEPQNQNRGVRRLVVTLPERAAAGRTIISVLFQPGDEEPTLSRPIPPLDEWAERWQEKPTPDQALQMLRAGNERFASGGALHPHADTARLALAAMEDQADHAYATIISCSDSRVPVELIFDAGVMDLFVIRVAGNVCDTDEIGSIEYGLAHVNTPVLVVLGHTQCGAVTAVTRSLHGDAHPLERNIPPLIDNIVPAAERAARLHPDARDDALIAHAIEENVWQGIEDLFMQSAAVRELVKAGKARVVGAIYDIGTGKVDWLPMEKVEAILRNVERTPGRATEP